MGISADFEKQYFVKKILLLSQKLSLCRNIALSQYRFVAILLVKIARLTRALQGRRKELSLCVEAKRKNEKLLNFYNIVANCIPMLPLEALFSEEVVVAFFV